MQENSFDVSRSLQILVDCRRKLVALSNASQWVQLDPAFELATGIGDVCRQLGNSKLTSFSTSFKIGNLF